MSNGRSSSAVRNLRSIFEHKAIENSSIASRAASPSTLHGSNKENTRPRSKIRTSFIPVELSKNMAARTPVSEKSLNLHAETPESLSKGQDVDHSSVTEPVAETAEIADENESQAVEHASGFQSGDTDQLDPDTSVSELSQPKPSTTSAQNATGTLKSPRSNAKISAKALSSSTTSHATKSSRSSLTAPTAASVARAAANERSDIYHPPPKPKPREPTRPQEISARLTAPTAASRARQGTTFAEKQSSSRPSLPATSTASKKSGGRPSLAPRDGENFLERMTRPTAASQHRNQNKTEQKPTTQVKQVARRPKPAATLEKAVASPTDLGDDHDQTVVEESGQDEGEDPVTEFSRELPAQTTSRKETVPSNERLPEDIVQAKPEADPPAAAQSLSEEPVSQEITEVEKQPEETVPDPAQDASATSKAESGSLESRVADAESAPKENGIAASSSVTDPTVVVDVSESVPTIEKATEANSTNLDV